MGEIISPISSYNPRITVTVLSTPFFDRDAASYDAARRGLIPSFDGFYGAALELIDDWRRPGALRVLDLGAGTGLFSALLLARHPDIELLLLDASEGMLAQARRRFSGHPAVSFIAADMAAADLGGPWDLVISALAIHHLEDAAKRVLFARIRRALVPGGLFVNAEQVAGATPALEERQHRLWLAQAERAGASAEAIAQAEERMAHDRCASLEDQLRWLREAGFADVDCCFRAWRFAVLCGQAAR